MANSQKNEKIQTKCKMSQKENLSKKRQNFKKKRQIFQREMGKICQIGQNLIRTRPNLKIYTKIRPKIENLTKIGQFFF